MQTSKDIFQSELHILPQTWNLTPLGKRDASGKVDPKAPYIADWANTDVDLEFINAEIEERKATGYGLRLGCPSGYVVAIDFDGQSAIEMGLEKFGELPNTVTWTSGRPGRLQGLFSVPERHRDLVKNKTVKTGVIGDDGKAEQLEFRYTGNQSVLPPSPHPITDGYHWINSPIDTPVAELPQVVIDYWLSLLAPKVTPKSKAKTKPELHSEPYTILPIPLKDCLAKSNRELLRGVTEGGRNHAGATLSRDLIGAANYLEAIGIYYEGDPRTIYDEFCDNCEPPIDGSEADVIWKSAEGDNPEPSCTSEGIDNIIAAWNRKADIDTELSQNLKESLNLKNGKAPNLFGGNMGKQLREAADNFNIPTSILEFIALPVLASRIDSRTKLVINPGTDFTVPAVRWCGLVGETGTMKSPVIKRLIKPMSKHQHEIAEIYKEVRQEYDLAHSAWKANKSQDKGDEPLAPPPMLDLYFSNFTIEAIVDAIQHYMEKGYLIFNDELAQFIKSLDMYRGGKGADRQQWLTIWDAGGIKNNRKSSGSVFIPQVSISIIGGIQPQTIRNMISGDESNLDGLWHRFSYVELPETTIEPFTELTGDLTDELDKIYRALSEQAQQTYWLSLDAKPLWAEWHYEMQNKRLSATQEMLKGVYPKFHGICGRNALILHCTYAAIAGTVPDKLIPASTVETAIAWTRWELSQTLLQYQKLGLTDDPELAKILKFIDRFTGKGWVSPSDARAWWSTKPKPSFDELKSFMAKVVSLGYAIDNDEPIASSKYRIQILEKSSQSSHIYPENYTQHTIQERLSVVTDSKNGIAQMGLDGGLNVVTTDSHESSHSYPESIEKGISDEHEKSVTTNGHESSHNPEPTVNGHYSDSSLESVTIGSHSINAMPSNSSSDVVTTLTTFHKNNLKIGDRAKLGDEIFIIDRIEDDFIGGHAIDGAYIGGNINSVQSIDVDKSPPTPNGYTTKDIGGGFKEIISNHSAADTTTEEGGIEYEC
jgi:Protein of unknown function (DUF3987)/Bifunctional DNA primase/polymerase, N-terminal